MVVTPVIPTVARSRGRVATDLRLVSSKSDSLKLQDPVKNKNKNKTKERKKLVQATARDPGHIVGLTCNQSMG